MLQRQLIVLKFGGSVLPNENALRRAVHEIYRWRRNGYGIVIAISALEGETNARLNAALERGDRPNDHVLAASVAQGELNSAAQLGLFLERAGVPSSVISPGAVNLLAEGPALDADPVSLDTSALDALLEEDHVVICPGYVATDDHARWVLLGRGGSDLSAFLLASALDADLCRLVKDVDGLYDSDPNAPGVRPDRFASASFDDALARDASIIQHKAIRFARSLEMPFEIGGLNGAHPTAIGDHPLTVCEPETAPSLTIALLGYGTVGQGVFDLLRHVPGAAVTRIALRDRELSRDIAPPEDITTTDALQAALGDETIVIELIGSVRKAYRCVKAALCRGAHVVTANKALIAEHGAELHALAKANGTTLSCAAAVGGSVPILERLHARPDAQPARIRAIINGSVNYLVDRLAAGDPLHAALTDAQLLGFAEADPSLDLEGFDAADKLRVIAGVIGGAWLSESDVDRQSLDDHAIDHITRSARNGEVVRQVSEIDFTADPIQAAVRFTYLEPDDPLHEVRAERNAAIIKWRDGSTEFITGRGAGRWPTAEAVLGDVLKIQRDAARRTRSIPTNGRQGVEYA